MTPVATTPEGRARPLLGWRAAEAAHLRRASSSALSAWRTAWGLDAVPAGRIPAQAATPRAPSCVPAADAPVRASGWQVAESGAGLWWCATVPGPAGAGEEQATAKQLVGAIARRLWGGSATPGWSDAAPRGDARTGAEDGLAVPLVEAAWTDWWARLAQGLAAGAPLLPASIPPADLLRRWSGAHVLTLDWLGLDLHLLVSPQVVRALLTARGEPVTGPMATPAGGVASVWRATTGQRVAARAQLAPFELDVGALMGLRVGDVVRCSHGLDEPLHVLLEDARGAGSPLCRGHLGRAGASRAIALTGPPPTPQP